MFEKRSSNFMKRAFTATFLFLCLAACEPAATVMSRSTGAVGTGAIQGATLNNSGTISISLPSENFSGTWVTVRDGGSQGLALLNTYGGGVSTFGTASVFSQADSGFGSAILRSDGGRSMRCEFRYSLVTITAVGICQTGDGELFDLQVA
jgi:hypothetical protein